MDTNQQTIDSVTEDLAKLFKQSATKTFGTRKRFNKKKQNKPWYGVKCSTARTNYHQARKRYNRFKTNQNKQNLNELSKKYKSTMNQEINKYKFEQEDKLRKLQTNRPKDYWKYINSLNKKRTNNSPTADEFYDYYKKIKCK